ncbi:MAG: hypothetical protein AAFQ61_05185 [Cyanobacteria bacterium J06626_23]
MALLEVTVEQILVLIRQLSSGSKQVIYEALRQDLESEPVASLDEESSTWLSADLTPEIPEYDWGPAGIPEGLPVSYQPGQGLVILTSDDHES